MYVHHLQLARVVFPSFSFKLSPSKAVHVIVCYHMPYFALTYLFFLVGLALMKMLSQSTNEKISPTATWESYML